MTMHLAGLSAAVAWLLQVLGGYVVGRTFGEAVDWLRARGPSKQRSPFGA